MKNWINWDKAVDIALIAGVVYLASTGKDGWGWLVFLLFIITILLNHYLFNKNYDFDKYWGDFK